MRESKPLIILASASPRRAELLQQLGLQFIVKPVEVEEIADHPTNPAEVAAANARSKVTASINANRCKKNEYILGADTIVVIDDKILGKPQNRDDAYVMLSLLRGRQHKVITAVVLYQCSTTRIVEGTSETTVYMNEFSEAELLSYLDSGEALDKAGAYGIQGKAAIFITGISGSYSNVVGLPLELLRELFLLLGVTNLLA